MAEHETISDIIAKKRTLAAEMEKALGDQHSSVEMLKDDADRLEAALKRERGDCAKLREALDESRRIASDLGGCRLNDYWKLNEIVRVCEAALAATEKEGGNK